MNVVSGHTEYSNILNGFKLVNLSICNQNSLPRNLIRTSSTSLPSSIVALLFSKLSHCFYSGGS